MAFLAPSQDATKPSSSSPPQQPCPILRVSNVVAYVLLILVNVGSSVGWFGASNAEISGRHPTPLTPHGWAFSIWGLIFLLQGIAVVWAAVPLGYGALPWKRLAVEAIGYGWQVGWAFQCLWQLLFAREALPTFYLSTFALFGATASFVVVLLRLWALADRREGRVQPLVLLLFYIPTSINTAWLSVASCLGVLVTAGAQGLPLAAQGQPAVALALVACVVGVWVLITRRDGAYGLTLLWALVAAVGRHERGSLVESTVLVLIAVVGLFTILAFTRQRPKRDVTRTESDMERQEQLLLERQESSIVHHAPARQLSRQESSRQEGVLMQQGSTGHLASVASADHKGITLTSIAVQR